MHLYIPHPGNFKYAEKLFGIYSEDELNSHILNLKITDIAIKKIYKEIRKYENYMIIISSDHWFRAKDRNKNIIYPSLFMASTNQNQNNFKLKNEFRSVHIQELIYKFFNNDVNTNEDIKLFIEKKLMKEISFRDPSGYVYMEKEKLLRKIKIDKLNFFENLFSAEWFNELVEQKKIQKSKIVSKSNDYFVVEHEFYPFHVMPHEMCDYQLYKSALLTLDLAIKAFENNLVIKDASAWNVFFIKSNPMFCDITSFEEWDENQNWFAYGQFYRHFIIPLILSKELDFDTSKLFTTNRDGFKPENASKLLGLKKYKSLVSFEGIVLPLLFNKKKIKVKKYSTNISKKIFAQTLNRLKNYIIKLEPIKKKTTWVDYETNRDHYSKQDMDDKYKFINEISQKHFEDVLDLGCNEGEYSKIFEATGSYRCIN